MDPVKPLGINDLRATYGDKYAVYSMKRDREIDPIYKSDRPEDFITLSSGKFKGAKVSKKMIQDVVASSRKNKTNPYLLLGLIGQESTFGHNSGRELSRRSLLSGWNLGRQYEPMAPEMFFANQKAPGVTVTKNNYGMYADVTDEKKLDEWLKKNPKMVDLYMKKLASTQPVPDDYNDFDQAIMQITSKGIGSYNPGDKKYESMVRSSAETLKSDKELAKIIASIK